MIETLRKFNRILNKRQKRNVVILLFLMITAAFMEAFSVGLMLPLVSALMDNNLIHNNEVAAAIAGWLGIESNITFILLCIITLIILYITKDLYIILETYLQNRFVFNCRIMTQSAILKQYMNRPYEFFLSASSGETVKVVQTDVENAFTMLNTILSFASEIIVSFALILLILFVNPFMTILVTVVMALSIVTIIAVVKPKMKRNGDIYNKSYMRCNQWLLQMVSGIKEIKVAGAKHFFQENFDKVARNSGTSYMRYIIWTNTPRLMIEMTSICSALVAVCIQVYQGVPFSNLVTALSAFVMVAIRLLPGANRTVFAVSQISYFEPSLNNVIQMMETLNVGVENEQHSTESTINSNSKKRMDLKNEIVLQDISYAYPETDTSVIDGLSIKIPIGSSVGIKGASGAGKTTVVDLLLGLLRPHKGHIYVDGVDIMENYKEWLSHIGYIPQSIFMLDGTIRQNIVFGKTYDSDREVWHALDEAQLSDFVRSLPDGLDTEIGESGIRLSGGQRQRIGIARALFSNPELLIFDEATSALDNETEAAVMNSINSFYGKKTMIIIAHRLTTIQGCDYVYIVEGGKVRREV